MIERDPITGQVRKVERPLPDLSQCRYLTMEEAMSDPVVIRETRRRKQLRDAEDAVREVHATKTGASGRKPWPMK